MSASIPSLGSAEENTPPTRLWVSCGDGATKISTEGLEDVDDLRYAIKAGFPAQLAAVDPAQIRVYIPGAEEPLPEDTPLLQLSHGPGESKSSALIVAAPNSLNMSMPSEADSRSLTPHRATPPSIRAIEFSHIPGIFEVPASHLPPGTTQNVPLPADGGREFATLVAEADRLVAIHEGAADSAPAGSTEAPSAPSAPPATAAADEAGTAAATATATNGPPTSDLLAEAAAGGAGGAQDSAVGVVAELPSKADDAAGVPAAAAGRTDTGGAAPADPTAVELEEAVAAGAAEPANGGTADGAAAAPELGISATPADVATSADPALQSSVGDAATATTASPMHTAPAGGEATPRPREGSTESKGEGSRTGADGTTYVEMGRRTRGMSLSQKSIDSASVALQARKRRLEMLKLLVERRLDERRTASQKASELQQHRARRLIKLPEVYGEPIVNIKPKTTKSATTTKAPEEQKGAVRPGARSPTDARAGSDRPPVSARGWVSDLRRRTVIVAIVLSALLAVIGAVIPLDVTGNLAGNPVRHWLYLSALVPAIFIVGKLCERLLQLLMLAVDHYAHGEWSNVLDALIVMCKQSLTVVISAAILDGAWHLLLVFPAADDWERTIRNLLYLAGCVLALRNLIVHNLMRSAVSKQFGPRVWDTILMQQLLYSCSTLAQPSAEPIEGDDTMQFDAGGFRDVPQSVTDGFISARNAVDTFTLDAAARFCQRGTLLYFTRFGRRLELRNARDARAAAKSLLENLAGEAGYLTARDLLGPTHSWRFRSPALQNQAMRLFVPYGTDYATISSQFIINAESLTLALEQRVQEVRSLKLSMQSTRSASAAIVALGNTVAGIAAFFGLVVIFEVDFTSVIVPASSLILSFTFAFGSTLKTLVESLVFLIYIHPYDVGDRIVINGETLFVEEMGLMLTRFKNVEGKLVTMDNLGLMTTRIENHRRTTGSSPNFRLRLPLATTSEQLLALRIGIAHWLSGHPRMAPDVKMYIEEILPSENLIVVGFWMTHALQWQDKPIIGTDVSNLMLRVNELLKELKITHSMPKQPIDITSMPGPGGAQLLARPAAMARSY